MVNDREHCHLYWQKISARYPRSWKQDFRSLGHPLLTRGNDVSWHDRTILLLPYFWKIHQLSGYTGQYRAFLSLFHFSRLNNKIVLMTSRNQDTKTLRSRLRRPRGKNGLYQERVSQLTMNGQHSHRSARDQISCQSVHAASRLPSCYNTKLTVV
jgi:hypothetical protein